MVKNPVFGAWQKWVETPAQPLAGYVTLDKSPCHSVPQLTPLKNGCCDLRFIRL